MVLTLEQVEGGWLLCSGQQYLSAPDGTMSLTSQRVEASVWSISIAGEEATISCDGGSISFDSTSFGCGLNGNPISL